ncbi:hypothetical protein O181_017949 [Austropuccinia psidii MF-1]|uniref:DUF7872 domain-containing protein n=1 Tax=Austropuccinia psidii MF-1 TaxID=1389203 RepID=A0A9Q3C6P8_9BASI|nr:hypothetical protein [Austropuccinia psidii MF-1]
MLQIKLITFFFLSFESIKFRVNAQKSSNHASQASLESDPCGNNLGNFSLTPELWKASRVDEYLAAHPTARNQSVAQFAASIGVVNFQCGIGMECVIGQICYPAIGKDYLVLYSIQQWNNYMNKFYGVVSSVILMLSDSSASIVSDFIPLGIQTDKSLFGWAIATLVFACLGTFTGPLVPALLPAEIAVSTAVTGANTANTVKTTYEAVSHAAADSKAVSNAIEAKDNADLVAFVKAGPDAKAAHGLPTYALPHTQAEEIQKIMASAGGSTHKAKQRLKRDLLISQKYSNRGGSLQKRGPPNVFAYTKWSFLDVHLSRLRTRLLNFVALTTQIALEAPIYSDKGVAPSILEGSFLVPNPSFEGLVDDMKKLGKIFIISELFVSLGFFATIGQEACKSKGSGGAWAGPNVWSSCDDKGIMRNIIQAKGDKIEKKIRNAQLLYKKYGYTVSDLVDRAATCQAKHGVYGSNNATAPIKESSICAFQLPVCDLTTPKMTEALKSKKKRDRLTKLCREEYHLPI